MRAGGTFSGLTHVVAMAALLFGWPAFSLVFERSDDVDEPIDVLTYGENADFKAAFRIGALLNDAAENIETKGGIDPDDISPTDTSGDAGFTSQGTAAADRTAAGRPDIARDGDPNSPGRARGEIPDDQTGTRSPRSNDNDKPPPADRPSTDRTMREIVINVQVARLSDLRAPQSEQRAATATLAVLPMQAAPTHDVPPPRDLPVAPAPDKEAAAQRPAPVTPQSAAAVAIAVTAEQTDAAPSMPRLQVEAPVAAQAAAPVAPRSDLQPEATGGEAETGLLPPPPAAPAASEPAEPVAVATGEQAAVPQSPQVVARPTRPGALATEDELGADELRAPAPLRPAATIGTPELEDSPPAASTPARAAEPARPASQGQPQASPRRAAAEIAAASAPRDAPPTVVKVDAPRTRLDPPASDRRPATAPSETQAAVAQTVKTDPAQPEPEAAAESARTPQTPRDSRTQAEPPGQRAETARTPTLSTPADPLSRLAALAAGGDEVLRRLLQQESRHPRGSSVDGVEVSRAGELPLSGATLPAPATTEAARGTSTRTEAVLREAAAAGNGKAALILAKRALRGEAATVTAAEIEGLLRRAAERGEVEAQLLLAVVKAKGIVVAQDRIEAHALLKVAAIATGAISELATALPPDPTRPKSPAARAVEAALAQVERQMSIEEVVKSQTIENAYRHALRVAPRGAQAGRFGTAANTEMLEAAAAGSTATLAELLARGADIEGRDTTGRTAIINAAWRGRVEAIELLVALGADFDVVDSGGLTAVQWAASNGHTEAVERLVAAGASIDAADNDGRTALMRAAWNGHTETVSALLRAGASTRRTDAKGELARDYAQRSGNKEVMRLLGGGT